jgi:hypothetical protein
VDTTSNISKEQRQKTNKKKIDVMRFDISHLQQVAHSPFPDQVRLPPVNEAIPLTAPGVFE